MLVKILWEHREFSSEIAEKLQQEYSLNPIVAKLLAQRGIEEESEAIKFLEPEIKHISDPFSMTDVAKGVDRVKEAISKGEKICIYGDYDVDGITSTSLMYLNLKNVGANVTYYIPTRDEGYGINSPALQKIYDEGSKVVITVDCGITSHTELEFGTGLGLDIIITDHHEISQGLPTSFAIINPKREDNEYKFKYLAGVGTAYMFLLALYRSLGADENFLHDMLDMVAIGTISDVVPLVSENRIFVHKGLQQLVNSKVSGLAYVKSKLVSKDVVTPIDVGFRIAPLFNAAGRLASADLVVKLLISEDRTEQEEIFSALTKLNKERQEITKNIMVQAEEQIDVTQKIFVCSSEEFHQGVVGIAAAKLTDKYSRPAIVLKIKEDGSASGSARSIRGLNIVKVMETTKDLLTKFGGHARAAGVTLPSENIPEFRRRIEEYCQTHVSEEDLIKVIDIDSDLEDFEVSVEFQKEVAQLGPFGQGNPEPRFAMCGVELDSPRKIGKDENHLMFSVTTKNIMIKNAVWFQKADFIDTIDPTIKYDIAFRIEDNFFKGRRSPKMYVEDIRPSQQDGCIIEYYKKLHNTAFPLQSFFASRMAIPVGTEILLNKYLNENHIVIRHNNLYAGVLNGEVSYLLKELNQNYSFRFKATVVSNTPVEEITEVHVLINRELEVPDITCSKTLMHEIKEMLVGNFDYNSLQKQSLRKLIIENESVELVTRRGRGIKTIGLSVAAFKYAKSKQKSLLVTKQKIKDPMIKRYFDIITPDGNPNQEYPFVFIDNAPFVTKGLHLRFSETAQTNKAMIDKLQERTNLKIVSADEPKVYHRTMKREHRLSFLKSIATGKEHKAERGILALLDD